MYIVGIDETGRGSLVGPLFVCGVAIREDIYEKLGYVFYRYKDSKELNEKQREKLFRDSIVFFKYPEVFGMYLKIKSYSNKVIDEKNIHRVNIEGIKEIIREFKEELGDIEVYVDGNFIKDFDGIKVNSIVKGDKKNKVISLASIIGKVIRDRYIDFLIKKDESLKKWGIEKNGGYPTREHLEFVKKFGVSKYHRISFLKEYLTIQKKLW